MADAILERAAQEGRYLGDAVDERPGLYYVSVVDGDRLGRLAGPYATHVEALAKVAAARKLANAADPRAAFYGFGTIRTEVDAPVRKTVFGVL